MSKISTLWITNFVLKFFVANFEKHVLFQKVDFFQKFVNRHLTRSNDKIALLTSDQLASSNMIFLLNNPDFSAFQTIFLQLLFMFWMFCWQNVSCAKMAAKFEFQRFFARFDLLLDGYNTTKWYNKIFIILHVIYCSFYWIFSRFCHIFFALVLDGSNERLRDFIRNSETWENKDKQSRKCAKSEKEIFFFLVKKWKLT